MGSDMSGLDLSAKEWGSSPAQGDVDIASFFTEIGKVDLVSGIPLARAR
jgi:hypothetical protein